jgi:hypothetical protein
MVRLWVEVQSETVIEVEVNPQEAGPKIISGSEAQWQ